MSETEAYDLAGNLISKTDFNGKITTYGYDVVNRLVTKVPDVTFGAPTVTFSYTVTSQRQMMIDPSGTTTYAYDLRDRLTQKATPEGTLSYTYDLAGNLSTIRSSNVSGTSVNYAHDVLNRLSSVLDNRLTSGTTTYAYDNAGNLLGFSYPNGVQTGYTYNTLNRLTNVQLANGATLASYAYQLGPTGNRTQVTESGGRQVNYAYDALYRLTNETIAGSAVNGAIGYVYDPVGNREQRTSAVTPVPAAAYLYDANDRLTTDTYDLDGNTTASGGNSYTYDFENHLINQNSGAVAIIYDGDGNRVSKTAAGVTTRYLVDDRNLTGYAQVLEEISGADVLRVYTYGLNRISQSQASGTSFYGYDGHGNVRFLTDATGTITDRYDYDAFGNIISQTGSTPNVYQYSGEQNDPNLGLYYLRARYMSQATGRFWTMDTIEGEPDAPITQHKYTYVGNEPVVRVDPSGNQYDLVSLSLETADFEVLSTETTVHAGGLFTKIENNLCCGVNPITNTPGFTADPRGVLGHLRPGLVDGSGAFGASRAGEHTHQGIDISAPVGTPVHANRAGTITYNGFVNGYGNTVVIRHAANASTLYAHLGSSSAGATVSQGQVIGLVGQTGNAAGQPASESHLHFGFKAGDILLMRGEVFNDPVNYLNSPCP